MAAAVGAGIVVVHPPFRWQRGYAEDFRDLVLELDAPDTVTDPRVTVENMFTVEALGRRVDPYRWNDDPAFACFPALTLDTSHAAAARQDLLELHDSMGTARAPPPSVGLHRDAGDEHLPPGTGSCRSASSRAPPAPRVRGRGRHRGRLRPASRGEPRGRRPRLARVRTDSVHAVISARVYLAGAQETSTMRRSRASRGQRRPALGRRGRSHRGRPRLPPGEFSLHPLAMEDVRHASSGPSSSTTPTHTFLVAYTSTLQEVDFFVGPHWVITVREADEDGSLWSCDVARSRFERIRPEQADRRLPRLRPARRARRRLLRRHRRRRGRAGGPRGPHLQRAAARRARPSSRSCSTSAATCCSFRRAVVPLRDVLNVMLRREVDWVDDAHRRAPPGRLRPRAAGHRPDRRPARAHGQRGRRPPGHHLQPHERR